MNTDKITSGFGNTEEMNMVADEQSKQTEKDYKKVETKGFRPPEYENKKEHKKDGSSEGAPQTIKITHSKGYVKDFENWVKSKEQQTKNENK